MTAEIHHEPELEGVIPIHKAVGFTSHDVVAKARRILGMKRIGHTGTLDPSVTGVLPLCIGRATRIVEYIQDLPKEYEAELVLGIATDTEDTTGEIVEERDASGLNEEAITEAIQGFMGTIEQVPPMYSAVKVNGKRLYELAREGKEVERRPRTVTIYDIQILGMQLAIPHPIVHFRVLCSKGTYIRTLCSDIGRKLGYPAAMGKLVRTRTGPIGLEQCVSLEELEQLKTEGRLAQCLIPVERALSHLPQTILSPEETVSARQGRTIPLSHIPQFENIHQNISESILMCVYTDDKQFLGLFDWLPQPKLLKPVKIFHPRS